MLPKLICKFWIRSRFQFFSLMLEGPFFLEKCGPKNQNCFLWWNLGSNSNMQNLIVKLIFFLFGTKDTDGNKAKAGISKRGFKKAKHTKFSGKQTFLIPPAPPPLSTCFAFLKHPFWDSPFCLITDDTLFGKIDPRLIQFVISFLSCLIWLWPVFDLGNKSKFLKMFQLYKASCW